MLIHMMSATETVSHLLCLQSGMKNVYCAISLLWHVEKGKSNDKLFSVATL